jgi:hypothetical protein
MFGLAVLVTASLGAAVPTVDAAAAEPAITVQQGRYGWVLRDERGREVVLRGFNAAGSAKLTETGLLPFRNRADSVIEYF